MFFDPLYFVFALPGLAFAFYASWLTKSTFKKYAKVHSSQGISGAQAARNMLNSKGIHNVTVERVNGFLSDHYDPSTKTLRLSNEVYGGTSLSSIGVACHEAGHAIQDAERYMFLALRTTLVPMVNITSSLAMPAFIIGILLSAKLFIYLGIILFTGAVIFSLVTLPVEWDASARAKRAILEGNVLSRAEAPGASAVLNAAFLTYVASAVSMILTLLYYLVRSGILGSDD